MEKEQSEGQMERTLGETGQLQPDIWVDTISEEGPGHPLPHVCELKERGRGTTDHRRSDTQPCLYDGTEERKGLNAVT